MKNLSLLTTFFIVFLCVVYLGVFTGSKINGLIANKKIALIDTVPAFSATPQATATIQPTPKTSAATLAQIPNTQIKTGAPVSSSQTPMPQSQGAAPVQTSAPVVINPSTPPPVAPPVVNTPPPAAPDPATPPPAPPAPLPTDPPPPPPPPPADNRCIIAISGGNYDVTEYRNIHSGGNVFQCGTDMTAAFLSEHPASFLQKMSRYRV